QSKDAPLYSASACPDIGPLTSRLPSTITYTFVAGYSYGGVGYGEHSGGGGWDTDRKTVRRGQEMGPRNLAPACRRNLGFGAAKRMRGCGECFKVTGRTASVFSNLTSNHQLWQSANGQANFAEPLGLQYWQYHSQHHASEFLQLSVQPFRNDHADGPCHGAGREFLCLRESHERWGSQRDVDRTG